MFSISFLIQNKTIETSPVVQTYCVCKVVQTKTYLHHTMQVNQQCPYQAGQPKQHLQEPANQVMVLEIIGRDVKKCEPIFIPQNIRMNGQIYQDLLIDLRANYQPGVYVFQQDGVTCHTSIMTASFLRMEGVEFWDRNMWPPAGPGRRIFELFRLQQGQARQHGRAQEHHSQGLGGHGRQLHQACHWPVQQPPGKSPGG